MITRIINQLEIDIDEKKANEIYLPQDFVKTIQNFDGSIETVKKSIYEWNNRTYLPLSIFWEITNRCCFSCPFCYINTKSAAKYEYQTFEDMKTIIDRLLERGMLFCTISGGECMLHPQFKYIYKYLKQKGVIVSVFTNGMLIDDDILNLFYEYKPYKVEISIYGMSNASFSKATLTGYNYETVLNNILKLKEIGIMVKCKTPITSVTSKDISDIQKWCNENKIDYYTSDELLPTYEGNSVDEYRVDDEFYKNAIKNKENILRKNCTYTFDYKKAWHCSAGSYTGIIAADGAFYPCMSSIGIRKYRFEIGNNIDNAINKYIEILKKEKGKKLDFCEGCNKCNICDKCVLSYFKDTKEQIKNNCEYLNEL